MWRDTPTFPTVKVMRLANRGGIVSGRLPVHGEIQPMTWVKGGGPSSLRRSARRDAVSGRRRHRVLGSRSKARRGLPASPPRAPDPDSAGATVELTSSKACWLANNVVARTGAYGWHHHRDIEGGTAGKPNTKNAPVGMDAPSTKLRPVGPTNREATW